jgi:exodeoxyribonuclease VII large subunit
MKAGDEEGPDLFSLPVPAAPSVSMSAGRKEEPRPLSVSELTQRVRRALEGGIGKVEVRGEISNFRKQPNSGHLYLTLKDEQSQVRVVMFRGDARGIAFEPADGLEVVVRGDLTVYEPRGEYQIKATSLRLAGKGTLQEQFEALKRKLAAEGLFEAARKRPLPLFPEGIGVVTSPGAAALRDFVRIARRRCPRLRLVVAGCRVQGVSAAGEVAGALALLNARREELGLDLVVVARGGGSLEDLWPFNEEIVARAVAASELPVISAVGHETDFTICDFAADLRASTPSAAAELLCRTDDEWRKTVGAHLALMHRAARRRLDEARWQLKARAGSYVFREPARIAAQAAQRVDDCAAALRRCAAQAVKERKERFRQGLQSWRLLDPRKRLAERAAAVESLGDRLRLLSPRKTLERGYAIVKTPEGRPLRRVAQAHPGQILEVEVSDGTFRAEAKKS